MTVFIFANRFCTDQCMGGRGIFFLSSGKMENTRNRNKLLFSGEFLVLERPVQLNVDGVHSYTTTNSMDAMAALY
uniref:Uncharacterized protein n=1 Tax=Arundo donax TaxID=35708 RepID=A0A0A9BIW9_ARUDO